MWVVMIWLWKGEYWLWNFWRKIQGIRVGVVLKWSMWRNGAIRWFRCRWRSIERFRRRRRSIMRFRSSRRPIMWLRRWWSILGLW